MVKKTNKIKNLCMETTAEKDKHKFGHPVLIVCNNSNTDERNDKDYLERVKYEIMSKDQSSSPYFAVYYIESSFNFYITYLKEFEKFCSQDIKNLVYFNYVIDPFDFIYSIKDLINKTGSNIQDRNDYYMNLSFRLIGQKITDAANVSLFLRNIFKECKITIVDRLIDNQNNYDLYKKILLDSKINLIE